MLDEVRGDVLRGAVQKRLDDLLVGAALAVVAGLCLSFRYLPMVDLPQHYAMVSIMANHADPAFDFAQRYTFDFVARPYVTPYALGALLTKVMPLGAAMRIVVALCTVAPLAGAWALLAATRRGRAWVLLAVPFAFGALWHWGFLNFLLGTGLMLGGLALVVVHARAPTRGRAIALVVLGFVLLFTHFHGLAMLVMTAPLFAWAFRDAGRGRRGIAMTLSPLVPATIAAAAFVLLTWRQAQGSWAQLNPGVGERIARFPEFLGAGVPDPWPTVTLAVFVIVVALAAVIGGPATRREIVAYGIALAAQVAMYLALPLNTNTATFVSARHALLIMSFALLLLPVLEGSRLMAARILSAIVAIASLVVVGRELAAFDREARDFDPVLAKMERNRRVAPLVYARGSEHVHPRTFPYLHFAGYYQAARGGDLARSFALVWNVPIRYRSDYAAYSVSTNVEWAPWLFSEDDLAHFDYLLVRGNRVPRFPPERGVREVAKSGAWTLLENPNALPAELPPR